MDKRLAAVLTGLGLAGGFAIAAIVLPPDDPAPAAKAGVPHGPVPVAGTGLAARIDELEAALAQEREARQLIEDELAALYAEIDALRAGPGGSVSAAGTEAGIERPVRGRDELRVQSAGEARRMALEAAGFSPDRVAFIMRREDELRVAAMQARFEAQQAGDMQAMFRADAASADRLRAELGDAEYERYLDAMNRPTSVRVGNVLESSPGRAAGLERGDEIVRYDGVRVFNYSDLNREQLAGTAGEDVVVEIVRDGMPMQVVMPRGPIGIEAQRRWRR